MIELSFRAWGESGWLINQFGDRKWGGLGCLATEARSPASIRNNAETLDSVFLVKIRDPSPENAEEVETALKKSEQSIREGVSSGIQIFDDDLKASLDNIAGYADEIAKIHSNVILDITCFPKRWFFVLVKELIKNPKVENLIVKYTQGGGYAENLSENPEILRHLPGFPTLSGRDEHDYAFIGVGFHHLSFATMFGEDRPRALRMLFPFPPGPPGLKKNWKFVESVERIISQEVRDQGKINTIDYTQLPALDVSQTFDAMRKITSNGSKTCYMLPFGPKPVSLAMCLYAICAELEDKDEVPVFYSQPQRYAINYTSTPLVDGDGSVSSLGYAIKHEGRLLYSLD